MNSFQHGKTNGISHIYFNCVDIWIAVAAAGLWCAGIKMEELQSGNCLYKHLQYTKDRICNKLFTYIIVTGLRDRMSHCVWSCSPPDPEELSAFTVLHGSPRLLLSFQVKTADWL